LKEVWRIFATPGDLGEGEKIPAKRGEVREEAKIFFNSQLRR
jgi:hypothetical protein